MIQNKIYVPDLGFSVDGKDCGCCESGNRDILAEGGGVGCSDYKPSFSLQGSFAHCK